MGAGKRQRVQLRFRNLFNQPRLSGGTRNSPISSRVERSASACGGNGGRREEGNDGAVQDVRVVAIATSNPAPYLKHGARLPFLSPVGEVIPATAVLKLEACDMM